MVIYAKMLDRGTFGMPIPASEDALTRRIRWKDLLKMGEKGYEFFLKNYTVQHTYDAIMGHLK